MINMQRDRACTEKGLKDKLREVSFALYETVLYLDVYPECKCALEHYERLIAELEQLTARYESQFGPLTVYSNTSDRWEWISSPWPWESEAN